MSIFKRIFRRPIYALLTVFIIVGGAGGIWLYQSGGKQGKVIPGSDRPKEASEKKKELCNLCIEEVQPTLSPELARMAALSALEEAQAGRFGLTVEYQYGYGGREQYLNGVGCFGRDFDEDKILIRELRKKTPGYNLLVSDESGGLVAGVYNAVIVTYPTYPYAYACRPSKKLLDYAIPAIKYLAENHPDNFKQKLVLPGTPSPERTATEKSSLHAAAYYGHIDALMGLLENGADVNAQDPWHWSPINYAIIGGREEAVFALLAHGAQIPELDVNAPIYPVAEAALHGNEGLLDYYREHGIKVSSEALTIAARANDLAAVKVLVERFGAQPSSCDLTATKNMEIVRYLISKGAGFDRYGRPTRLPFESAVSGGREDLLAEFRKHAPLPLYSRLQNKALEIAIADKSWSIAHELMSYPFHVMNEDEEEKFLNAVRAGDSSSVEKMIWPTQAESDMFRNENHTGVSVEDWWVDFVKTMKKHPRLFSPAARLYTLSWLRDQKSSPGKLDIKEKYVHDIVTMKPDLRDSGLDWEVVIDGLENERKRVEGSQTVKRPWLTPEEAQAKLEGLDENIRIIAEAFRPKEK